MGWMVQESNPVDARFSTYPDQPWGPPSLLYKGYQVSFLGVERPGCDTDSLTSVHY